MNNRKLNIPVIVLLVVGAIVGVTWLTNSWRLDNYLEDPKEGDIYILEGDNIFSPMKVMDVSDSTLAFYNYMYSFGEACPDRQQILDHEWDYNFVATYQRSEINRLFEEGRIIEIYRD